MRRGFFLAIGVGVAGLAYVLIRAAPVLSGHAGFVGGLWRILADKAPNLSNVSRVILIGQAAHEAEWGKARPAFWGHNLWNITAGSKWKGPTLQSGDLEYGPDGTAKHIIQSFRVYPSDEEAVSDLLSFLAREYPRAWQSLQDEDSSSYVSNLRAGGFFTEPLSLYQSAMAKAIKEVTRFLT